MQDSNSPPVWDIEGTKLGARFAEHLKALQSRQEPDSAIADAEGADGLWEAYEPEEWELEDEFEAWFDDDGEEYE